MWHVQRVSTNSYTRIYNFGYHSTDDRLKGNNTMHTVCWSKSFCFCVKTSFFHIFPSLIEKKKEKERNAAQKHAINRGIYQHLGVFFVFFKHFMTEIDGKSCFSIKEKSFWPANGMRSTCLLVKIHNRSHSSYNISVARAHLRNYF